MKTMENPLLQNSLTAFSLVVYLVLVGRVSRISKGKGWISAEVARKIPHVLACSTTMFWPYFDTTHWSWMLNVLAPFLGCFVFPGIAFLGTSRNRFVMALSRTGDPKELLEGPLLLCFVMVYCGLMRFMEEEGVIVMACIAFGDGLAPLVGSRYPILSYSTYPFGPKDRKSLGGTLTFVLCAMFGIQLMRRIVFGNDNFDPKWYQTVQLSVLGAVAEGLSGSLDNPAIALAVHGYLLQS